MLADEAVDLLNDIVRQGDVELLGLAQVRGYVDVQHAPAHVCEIGMRDVSGRLGYISVAAVTAAYGFALTATHF